MRSNQKSEEETIGEHDDPVHVESELKAMREYFSAKGTSNGKMKEDLAFLLLRMILSTPHTVNSTNATAQFLTPFVKFHFNDALDEILTDISEVNVSTKHSGRNLAMKWDSIVEKLEAYLEDEEKGGKNDPSD